MDSENVNKEDLNSQYFLYPENIGENVNNTFLGSYFANICYLYVLHLFFLCFYVTVIENASQFKSSADFKCKCKSYG